MPLNCNCHRRIIELERCLAEYIQLYGPTDAARRAMIPSKDDRSEPEMFRSSEGQSLASD